MSILSLSLLLSVCILCVICDDPPGHMQPLGSHMPPVLVEETTKFPDPITFYDKYVDKNSPVIFRGIMKETEVYANWRYDSYLRERFGHEEIGAENGKKENRTATGELFKFSEFLDRYNTSDIYMVGDMPLSMQEEWSIPSFLLCGGYTENLAFINVWFSSGGTKSVLHTDSMENFHCVVSGRKVFVMFEPHYSEAIGPEHKNLGYYHIDVAAVDMIKYPNISSIPWYKAVVNEGDCLYLPYLWLHHVDSYGRNMAVNVWWIQFEFDREDCESMKHRPGFAPIGQFSISHELQVKHFLLELKRPDGSIHVEDVYEAQKNRNPTGDALSMENIKTLFDKLIPGCNGLLHESDFRGDRIKIENYRDVLQFVSKLMEEADGIHRPPPNDAAPSYDAPPPNDAPPPYDAPPPNDASPPYDALPPYPQSNYPLNEEGFPHDHDDEGGGDGHPHHHSHAQDEL